MNEHGTNTHDDEPAPLDGFEQRWVGLLNEPGPERSRTSEDFVGSVVNAHTNASRPSVIARIGYGPVPLAAAAALLIAAVVGWYVLTGQGSGPVTAHNNETPQPEVAAKVVPLGSLISQAQASVTRPAASLTDPVRDPEPLISIQRIQELINNPVPDFKQLLTPSDRQGPQPDTQPTPQQSRA